MSFSRLCAHVSEGRERVPQQPAFFLWMRHSQLAFCILKERANCSAWFIFPRFFNTSLPDKAIPGTSWRPYRIGRLTRRGSSATSRKSQELITTDIQRGISVHVLWNRHSWYAIIRSCNVCCVEFSIIRVGIYDGACSVHLSEHVHYT